mgnify:CR=1 FL=1
MSGLQSAQSAKLGPGRAPPRSPALAGLQDVAYRLSRCGLALLASVIGALLLFAAVQEYRHHNLLDRLHTTAAAAPSFVEPAAIRRAIGVVEAAQQSAQASQMDRSDALSLLRMLALHPGLDGSRRLVFTECETGLDLPAS